MTSRFRQGGGKILAVTDKPAPIVDWTFMHPVLNTSNWLTNEADGVGYGTGASGIMLVLAGVGKDNKFTASMKYTTGTVDLRIMTRLRSNLNQDSVDSSSYYWAGCAGTNFRLGKTVAGVFTTLGTVAFTLPADRFATFTIKAYGSNLVATIDDGVQAAQSLSAVDSDIPAGGCQAFRSGPTNTPNIWCRSWRAEEVAA